MLLAVLAVVGACWGFVELADVVMEGGTHAADRAILLALRDPGDPSDPIGPRYVHEIGRDLTALGGTAFLTLLTLGVFGYLRIVGRRRDAWVVAVGVLGALLWSLALKEVFARPRPALVPHASIVYTASFPSGHSTLAAATYLTLGMVLAHVHRGGRLRAYLLGSMILLAVLVGVSRVYVGVHWPTDVLAGWTLGAAWAVLCWTAAHAWRHRARADDDAEPGPSVAVEPASSEG